MAAQRSSHVPSPFSFSLPRLPVSTTTSTAGHPAPTDGERERAGNRFVMSGVVPAQSLTDPVSHPLSRLLFVVGCFNLPNVHSSFRLRLFRSQCQQHQRTDAPAHSRHANIPHARWHGARTEPSTRLSSWCLNGVTKTFVTQSCENVMETTTAVPMFFPGHRVGRST